MPNKYPALEHHEVVVHTPRHARTIADLTDAELLSVASVWQQREASGVRGEFGHLQVVINEGRDAGASLAHSHSQLLWSREYPPVLAAEATGSLAELIAAERKAGVRVVLERHGLVLLCPYASRAPYELLVAPVRREEGALRNGGAGPALALLAEGLRRIRRLEGSVPVNAWLHDAGHWHLELVPRLTIPASLELGFGIYVNTLAPEEAADRLREVAG